MKFEETQEYCKVAFLFMYIFFSYWGQKGQNWETHCCISVSVALGTALSLETQPSEFVVKECITAIFKFQRTYMLTNVFFYALSVFLNRYLILRIISPLL